jgi:hypothetical protein
LKILTKVVAEVALAGPELVLLTVVKTIVVPLEAIRLPADRVAQVIF